MAKDVHLSKCAFVTFFGGVFFIFLFLLLGSVNFKLFFKPGQCMYLTGLTDHFTSFKNLPETNEGILK